MRLQNAVSMPMIGTSSNERDFDSASCGMIGGDAVDRAVLQGHNQSLPVTLVAQTVASSSRAYLPAGLSARRTLVGEQQVVRADFGSHWFSALP